MLHSNQLRKQILSVKEEKTAMRKKLNPPKSPTGLSAAGRNRTDICDDNDLGIHDTSAIINRATPIPAGARWQGEIHDDIAYILRDISESLNSIPQGLLRYQDLSRWTFDNPSRAERTASQLFLEPEDLSEDARSNRIMDWLDKMYPTFQEEDVHPTQNELDTPLRENQTSSSELIGHRWFYTEVDFTHWLVEDGQKNQGNHPRGSFVKEGGDWRCVSA